MRISHKRLTIWRDNIRRVIADIRPQMLERVIEIGRQIGLHPEPATMTFAHHMLDIVKYWTRSKGSAPSYRNLHTPPNSEKKSEKILKTLDELPIVTELAEINLSLPCSLS
ncbi:hypothetical protein TNCV_4502781 [Trichonephila clavipes]|nr:hypothetical protein TNCV_4502781 [Trichonephila clavipes]